MLDFLPLSTLELFAEFMRERGQTLALAESCTGGLAAMLITDAAGASAYFLGSVVSYENAVKEHLLGVDPAALTGQGAVSEAVALQMATGARERLGADLALSFTGIAGPEGGTPEKPVGTVWMARADADGGAPAAVVPGARPHPPGGGQPRAALADGGLARGAPPAQSAGSLSHAGRSLAALFQRCLLPGVPRPGPGRGGASLGAAAVAVRSSRSPPAVRARHGVGELVLITCYEWSRAQPDAMLLATNGFVLEAGEYRMTIHQAGPVRALMLSGDADGGERMH